MRPRFVLLPLTLAALPFFAGCQKTIDNTRVSSATPGRLTFWTSQAANDFSAETSAQIRDAVNEVKLAIYRLGKASTPSDIEDHLCAEIHELTVRELLIRGFEFKETRLQIERGHTDIPALALEHRIEVALEPRHRRAGRGRHRLRDHRQQTSKKQHQAHEIPLGIPSGGK